MQKKSQNYGKGKMNQSLIFQLESDQKTILKQTCTSDKKVNDHLMKLLNAIANYGEFQIQNRNNYQQKAGQLLLSLTKQRPFKLVWFPMITKKLSQKVKPFKQQDQNLFQRLTIEFIQFLNDNLLEKIDMQTVSRLPNNISKDYISLASLKICVILAIQIQSTYLKQHTYIEQNKSTQKQNLNKIIDNYIKQQVKYQQQLMIFSILLNTEAIFSVGKQFKELFVVRFVDVLDSIYHMHFESFQIRIRLFLLDRQKNFKEIQQIFQEYFNCCELGKSAAFQSAAIIVNSLQDNLFTNGILDWLAQKFRETFIQKTSNHEEQKSERSIIQDLNEFADKYCNQMSLFKTEERFKSHNDNYLKALQMTIQRKINRTLNNQLQSLPKFKEADDRRSQKVQYSNQQKSITRLFIQNYYQKQDLVQLRGNHSFQIYSQQFLYYAIKNIFQDCKNQPSSQFLKIVNIPKYKFAKQLITSVLYKFRDFKYHQFQSMYILRVLYIAIGYSYNQLSRQCHALNLESQEIKFNTIQQGSDVYIALQLINKIQLLVRERVQSHPSAQQIKRYFVFERFKERQNIKTQKFFFKQQKNRQNDVNFFFNQIVAVNQWFYHIIRLTKAQLNPSLYDELFKFIRQILQLIDNQINLNRNQIKRCNIDIIKRSIQKTLINIAQNSSCQRLVHLMSQYLFIPISQRDCYFQLELYCNHEFIIQLVKSLINNIDILFSPNDEFLSALMIIFSLVRLKKYYMDQTFIQVVIQYLKKAMGKRQLLNQVYSELDQLKHLTKNNHQLQKVRLNILYNLGQKFKTYKGIKTKLESLL